MKALMYLKMLTQEMTDVAKEGQDAIPKDVRPYLSAMIAAAQNLQLAIRNTTGEKDQ